MKSHKNENYNNSITSRNDYQCTRTSRATGRARSNNTATTNCRRVIFYFTHLLINSHGVQARVHDVHPAVSGRKYEQRHQRLAQIVEIVFLIHPCVFLVSQAFLFVPDVFNVGALAVKECPFEELYGTQNDWFVVFRDRRISFLYIIILLCTGNASTDSAVIALS